MSKVVAVIPARGGSKGIPRKNLEIYRGISLVEHAVTFAKSLGLDRVILSSDACEILEIGRSLGVSSIRRSSETSTDCATDFSVVTELLADSRLHSSEILIWIRPTSPIRLMRDVISGLEMILGDSSIGSIRSISPVSSEHHPSWQCRLNGTHLLDIYGRNLDFRGCQRRQDLPPSYFFTCQFEVIRLAKLVQQGIFYPREVHGFIVDDPGVDINTPADLKTLRATYV